LLVEPEIVRPGTLPTACPACQTIWLPSEIVSEGRRGIKRDAAEFGGTVTVRLKTFAGVVVLDHATDMTPFGVGTVPVTDWTALVPGDTENVEKPGPVGCTPRTRVERKYRGDVP
jgi:hypothetical protein